MKKKLEADLVSIAHRILKQKNREELDQLLQETLKLYEKLLVLKFVDEQFGDTEPTIGHASALFKLEETYGLEEPHHVKANEVEAHEEEVKAEKEVEKAKVKEAEKEKNLKEKEEADADKEEVIAEQSGNDEGQPVPADEETEVAETEEKETEPADDKVEPVPAEEETEVAAETEEKVTEAADEEEAIEKESEQDAAEPTPAEEEPVKEETPKEEPKPEQPNVEEPTGEPEVKVEVVKPEETIAAEEKSAASVFEKTQQSSLEEQEKAADAEIKTIAPDAAAKVEESKPGFDFSYERKPAPQEPVQQREISFEDFRDYKEPEFVKKEAWPTDFDAPVTPVPPEVKQEIKGADVDDWQNWEPKKTEPETPKAAPTFDWEAKLETPKTEGIDDWKNWEPAKTAEPEKPATPSFNWNEPESAEPKQGFSWDEPKKEPVKEEKPAAPKTLNDSFGKTISLALNDRIAFEKHLFAGSSDDLNRVISQLNTLNSLAEAQNFIEDLVKPDYNSWVGKEEYEERFMAIVEKRFS